MLVETLSSFVLPQVVKYRLANFVMSYLIQSDHKTGLMDDIFRGYMLDRKG